MLKNGILGCGRIAQVRHIPEYANNPNGELVGFFIPTRSRAEDMAAEYGKKYFAGKGMHISSLAHYPTPWIPFSPSGAQRSST